jgi:hypothetical protein
VVVAVLALWLFAAPSASANSCVSLATGNWNAPATWTACGGVVPTSVDTVEIRSGFTVTVNVANAVAASIQVGGNPGVGTGTLVFNAASKVTVSGSVTLGSSINAGNNGTITMTLGGTLSARSLALGTLSAKTWTPGTGTVELTLANTLPATIFTSFNNLTITAGTTTLGVSVPVNGTLTLTAGALSIGARTLTLNGAISTVSGALTGGASSNITIGGTGASTTLPAVTLNNLIMNRANGLSLGGNVTVGGTLTFTSGNITPGANTFYISSTGTVARTSGHVVGSFRKSVASGATSKTFELGATNYTPVTVAFASVTTAGDLTAVAVSGDHANIGTSTLDAAKTVNRVWTLTNSGLVFTNYNATFEFVAAVVDAGADTSLFVVGNYSGGSWSYPAVGTKTATTTQATGLTAFGDFEVGELAAPTYSISGTVFEDKNYGGGAGRSLVSSSGTAVPGARVELYTGDNYTTFATTDASGNYSFGGLSAATYAVRVVNGTVNSSRTGTEVLPPVQTYRTDASSGAAVAVTYRVGGEVPASVDAGVGSTTLTALTVGAITPQSITSVVLGASSITGLQFGYSYNVIVNKNNAGQGSLRQFLLNANALSNTGLAQSGLTAGIDTAVFMLADGTARPGLTASYATQFTSGIASVALTSALPTVSESVRLDASLQPGYVSTPMIELNGASAGAGVSGLIITAGSSTVRGLIINRFPIYGINLTTNGSNTITGNYIGTSATGTSGISNAAMGIFINGASSGNTIGGTTAGARNVVSGNSVGVYITGASASGNTVQGNYIGTNATGSGAVANINYGVLIELGATTNIIGGTAPGASNVISGNSTGVVIYNTGTNNNSVLGNYIGTNSTGTAAVANTTYGVRIGGGAATNTVGGTTTAARNIISGNTQAGVHIESATTTGNLVQGNYIGANAAGTGAVANGVGVNILTSADNNSIGGTAAGAGNLIYGNGAQGIVIGADSTGNAILSNSIYGNTGIGIDLTAVAAANDGTKTGTLANSGMDSAVFTAASLNGTTLTYSGYVGSTPGQALFAGASVEIFKSGIDATGFGEGQTLLGTVTADASGNLSGVLTVSGLAQGDQITGTATDAADNTSEFGANFAVSSTYNISGTVFEDKNYGGGAGRSLASSSGVVRASARVELFNSGGTYQTFATTDGSGSYTFSGLVAGTYIVRVVNVSVTTSRGVFTSTPTQTFRTDASSGAAVAVTDHVGGETPGLLDAVNGSTTLAALTTGTFTAQSITSVALSSGNISGVDFGYSFNVIVNANDSGQGSLRRVLNYANAMSNTGLAQSGLRVGIDHAVFMLADGTARAGLTASYASQFTSGVATIALLSSFPTISDPIVLDATRQPGYAGVPVIELNGDGAGGGVSGLTITAGSSTVRGLVINRFTVDGISLSTGGNNTVAGNYVGTNAAGTAVSANTNAGIKVSTSGNIIGGTTAAARNVISGNTSTGLTIDGGTGNLVQGNYIGTNAAATAVLANGSTGVYLLNAANNTIGGTTAGAGNVISGNILFGVAIGIGSTGNSVLGNYVGTDPAGAGALPNGTGVLLFGTASGNTVGGTTAAARNVISGNTAFGVYIDGATGNLTQGNYVGVNAAGTAALANGNVGVYILNGSTNNTVGGTTAGAGNVVSGNTNHGILIDGAATAGNIMQGNYVGTNAGGTGAIANGNTGIYLINSTKNNTVGGTTVGARNIVSGNVFAGIILNGVATTGNLVQGNYVGTNAAGTGAIANGTLGIWLLASNNTIGGTTAAARNVISGNAIYGIVIQYVSGNLVQGNYVGLGADGTTALANNGIGIYISDSAANNTIGGTAAGAGNVISGNGGKGIIIIGGTGNAMLSNSIYANTGIGIDLNNDGLTPNDGTKSGAFANSGMDAPVFTTKVLVGTNLTLSGYVGSAASQAAFAGASVQVFKSDNDSSGFGEGQTYLGTLTADASGNFSGNLTVSLAVGDRITGTATDGSNNTSEFAANAMVANPPPGVVLLNSVMPSGTQPPGTDLVYTVAFTNEGGQAARVFMVVDPIPAFTDFKIGSPGTVLGTTGMTVAVEFSNDNASTWSYTPVSGAGGAVAGYDRLVTHVRWRFTGNLSQTSPNNTGSVSCTVRIR